MKHLSSFSLSPLDSFPLIGLKNLIGRRKGGEEDKRRRGGGCGGGGRRISEEAVWREIEKGFVLPSNSHVYSHQSRRGVRPFIVVVVICDRTRSLPSLFWPLCQRHWPPPLLFFFLFHKMLAASFLLLLLLFSQRSIRSRQIFAGEIDRMKWKEEGGEEEGEEEEKKRGGALPQLSK